MNTRQFNKYHKKFKDAYGNKLNVGDMVVVSSSYFRNVYIAIVHHFAEHTVVVRANSVLQDDCPWKAQKHSNSVVLLQRGCKGYPYFYDSLDEYGKSITKSHD